MHIIKIRFVCPPTPYEVIAQKFGVMCHREVSLSSYTENRMFNSKIIKIRFYLIFYLLSTLFG